MKNDNNTIEKKKRKVQLPETGEFKNPELLIGKTGKQWVIEGSKEPSPKMLFGPFWIDGEICFLYGDTNVGKSTLACQIGVGICKGEDVLGFDVEVESQTVVYIDFELTKREFADRYNINFWDSFDKHENFIRCEIDPNSEIPTKFRNRESFIQYEIERHIKETGTKILIIDNLSALRQQTQEAKDANKIMEFFITLRNKYHIAILVLGHTIKRDPTKPLCSNDLAGSKQLINLVSSSFAIGASSLADNTKYIKQIKARNTKIMYGEDNVCICHIEKSDNHLRFVHDGFSKEKDHLPKMSGFEKKIDEELIYSFRDQGLSYRAIETETGINFMKVKRILDNRQDEFEEQDLED